MSAPGFLFPLLFLGISGLAIGEGSVSWEDVERLLDTAPEIRAHIAESLDIEEAGSGSRLGRHWGELHGARIGPYRFKAKPRRSAGNWRFALVIETDTAFLDSRGRVLKGDPEGNATGIRESFVAARLEPLAGTRSPESPPPSISEEDAKARSHWISQRWKEISGRRHRIEKISLNVEDDPIAGMMEKRHHPEDGQVESILVEMTTGDHGGFSEEFFYADGKVFFVLRDESHWRFDPEKEGRTIDIVSEERYYFTEDGRNAYRALSKKYQANSEQNLKDARDAARNTPLEYSRGSVEALMERSRRLLRARTKAAVLAIYGES